MCFTWQLFAAGPLEMIPAVKSFVYSENGVKCSKGSKKCGVGEAIK
jgi:hypothetical protein